MLVDDHAIVRQGLRSVLEREPQFAIVGEASSAAEALAVVAHQHPSIVLLDLKLSTSSDSEGLQQIQVAERVKSEQGMSAWPTCSQKTGQTAGSANTGSSGSGSSGSGSSNSGSANSRSAVSGAAGSGSGAKADDAAATPAPQPTGASAAGTHTVATGDTLSGIASSNGTTVQALAQRSATRSPTRTPCSPASSSPCAEPFSPGVPPRRPRHLPGAGVAVCPGTSHTPESVTRQPARRTASRGSGSANLVTPRPAHPAGSHNRGRRPGPLPTARASRTSSSGEAAPSDGPRSPRGPRSRAEPRPRPA